MLHVSTRVSYSKITVIFLGIFDCYVGCTCLKTSAIRALCASMRNALVHFESVWVHRLHRAASLVAEVESAFVLPLRGAFDAAIKAQCFPIGINNLEATETTICHSLSSLPRSQPVSESDGSSS